MVKNVVKAFTPKPYDENEAAMDALSGREACRHGHWPHQGGVCGLCAAEVAAKAALSLFAAKP
jgi:hypothetical protein